MTSKWQRMFNQKTRPDEYLGAAPEVDYQPRPTLSNSAEVPLVSTPKANSNTPPSRRNDPDDVIDQIGQRNEELRSRFQEVTAAFENIDHTRRMFEAALEPIENVLRESQETKAQLQEAGIRYGSLSHAHEIAKRELSQALAERETVVNHRDRLAAQTVELQQSLSSCEHMLDEIHAVAQDRANRVGILEAQIEERGRQLSRALEDSRQLRETSEARERDLLALEEQRTGLVDQLAAARNESRALRQRADDLTGQHSRSLRQLGELETKYEDLQRRQNDLESALAQESGAHSRLKTASQEETDRLRAAIEGFETQLTVQRARSESAERGLNEARQSLREKAGDVKALENRLLDARMSEQAHAQRIEELMRDLTEMRNKYNEIEASRSVLAERATALAKSSKGKELTLRNHEQKISQMETRISELTSALHGQRNEAAAKAAALEDKLVSASLARSLAEGALQTVRAELQSVQREVAAARSGMARPAA